MPRGIYIARMDNVSVSGIRGLVQLNVASTCAAIITEAYIDFDSTTSTTIRTRIAKRTTAGTPGSTPTPVKISGHPTALSTFGVDYASGSLGTLGDTIYDRYVNYVPGLNYLPIPENMIELAPSERLMIDWPVAPGAAITISVGMVWKEIG